MGRAELRRRRDRARQRRLRRGAGRVDRGARSSSPAARRVRDARAGQRRLAQRYPAARPAAERCARASGAARRRSGRAAARSATGSRCTGRCTVDPKRGASACGRRTRNRLSAAPQGRQAAEAACATCSRAIDRPARACVSSARCLSSMDLAFALVVGAGDADAAVERAHLRLARAAAVVGLRRSRPSRASALFFAACFGCSALLALGFELGVDALRRGAAAAAARRRGGAAAGAAARGARRCIARSARCRMSLSATSGRRRQVAVLTSGRSCRATSTAHAAGSGERQCRRDSGAARAGRTSLGHGS